MSATAPNRRATGRLPRKAAPSRRGMTRKPRGSRRRRPGRLPIRIRRLPAKLLMKCSSMLPKIAFLAFRASSRIRKEIVQRALAYYRDFLKLHHTTVKSQTTALILERLANIERMTNSFDSAVLGHYAEAETLYKTAHQGVTNDETVGDGLAALERDFAEALRMNGRLTEAFPIYALALKLARARHDAKCG